MAAPELTVSQQGVGVVDSDLLNTFLQGCDTLAELQAFVGAPGLQVYLRGYFAPGDGGQGAFYWNTTATGPGNNTTIVVPYAAAIGAWVRLSFDSTETPPEPGTVGGVYIDDLGAIPNDPSFDNAPIITSALATYPYVRGHAAAYYCNSGITIPDGVTFEGDVFFANLAEPFGSQLIFANNVSTCVQVGTGNTNNPAGFTKWQVRRQGASPPAGSTGILFAAGQSPKFDWIGSYNHAVCIEFAVQSGSPAGITAHAMGIYTAGATDAHIVVNTWPELFLTLVRTGCNGGVDANCNTHLRITGGGTGGDGPNTIQFVNWQATQGQNTASYWLQLIDLVDTASNALEFRFSTGHVEGIGTACIMTDASCTFLNRLNLTDIEFNCAGIEMWAINAATQFSDCYMSGCNCFVSTWTFQPTIATNVFNIVNSFLGSTCTIAAPTFSTMNLSNCAFGNLVVSGAGNIVFSGCNLIGGSLTNNSTGRVLAANNTNFSGQQNWTPNLQFGGANVGVTYGTQTGEFEWLSVDTIRISYAIVLTSKGSSTGSATLSNLPATANSTYGPAAGGAVGSYTSMTGLTGALSQSPAGGATVLDFLQNGATGLAAVTNSAFTNTSALSGELILRV